jgi:Protein of unknown function (DUF3551)
MRAIFAALVLLIAAAAADTASAEISYPWCKQSFDGGTNCGFISREQCQAGGRTGYCVQNPAYTGPSAGPRPRRS